MYVKKLRHRYLTRSLICFCFNVSLIDFEQDLSTEILANQNLFKVNSDYVNYVQVCNKDNRKFSLVSSLCLKCFLWTGLTCYSPFIAEFAHVLFFSFSFIFTVLCSALYWVMTFKVNERL